MNFEHYKNFVTIAECRSISAAAEQLHIAQSALSSQVKHFEEDMGTELLIRKPRSVELIDAGTVFYRAVKNMIRLDEAARKEIRDCRMGKRGILKLGLTPSLPDGRIQKILQNFSEHNPNVSYNITKQIPMS